MSERRKEINYNVLDKLDMTIVEKENDYNFNQEDLFEIGLRINPKRSFLFVSKLLGKHLDVHPNIPKVAGHLLANKFNLSKNGKYFSNIDVLIKEIRGNRQLETKDELLKSTNLEDKTLFIGFAETATGLGQSVASAFKNSYYVQTTRDILPNKQSLFDFKEEHSHSTDHSCYMEDFSILDEVSHVVLIDDEITTGKTCLNLIKELNKIYPNKKYTMLTLLDWRNPTYEEDFENFFIKYGIDVPVVSLMKGNIVINKEEKIEPNKIKDIISSHIINPNVFEEKLFNEHFHQGSIVKLKETGLFGLDFNDFEEIEEIAKTIGLSLKEKVKGKRTLCLGNGELIYLPSRIASYMGDNLFYKSTTLSPIYTDKGYLLTDRISFINDDVSENFLYNLGSSDFDEVFMFFENKPSSRLQKEISKELNSKGIKYINFVELLPKENGGY